MVSIEISKRTGTHTSIDKHKGGPAGDGGGNIMNMQQAALETRQQAGFVIEATSHCRNGKSPRWSFLVLGVGGKDRHGMVGTDENGRGLYIYASLPGSAATRQQLLAPENISLPDTLSRYQANDELMKLLDKFDWENPQFKPKTPRFALYAVT